MCDTLVALANSTANKKVLFAKNSNRDPNEAQFPILVKGNNFTENTKVKCTYIEIPQVRQTYTILLSKPFWMWGGEMGVNEYGVAIGNEALFTKVKRDSSPKLLGMDILRLALERSKTAEEAMHVIIDLLEKYGQGGNCGFVHKLDYDNSYLIADSKEAWVLETAGKQWAAEHVKNVRSTSNRISIETKWDLSSNDLVHYAIDRGWCKKKDDFNFRKCYSEPIYTFFSGCKERLDCIIEKLESQKGKIDVKTIMNIFRSHASERSENWSPVTALAGTDVCMHFGFGPIRINQATASMISEIGEGDSTHWMTATSAPCTSIFKPIWMDAGLPDLNFETTSIYDEKSFWWQHEKLHRAILLDYSTRLHAIADEIDALQNEIIEKSYDAAKENVSERFAITNNAFKTENNLNKSWFARIGKMQILKNVPFYYAQMLKTINHQAKIK
jgi:dipeptidase